VHGRVVRCVLHGHLVPPCLIYCNHIYANGRHRRSSIRILRGQL
jgi:hypothetical protein